MNISIPSYEILNFETESLVVSNVGISKVHSKSLLDVLVKLKSYKYLSEEEIYSVLSESELDPKQTFEFLDKIISLKPMCEIFFEKTVIIHDWHGVVEFEKLLRQELKNVVEFCTFSDELVSYVQGKKYFIVLVCDRYDYDFLKSLYFELANVAPKSAISVYYRMGAGFYIGQPYIPDLGSPCHFCTIDRLINSEASSPESNSWAKVLQFCKSRHAKVPTKSLTLFQELIVIGAISRKIKFLTEAGSAKLYQDNILCASYLQLADGRVVEEHVSHWSMCDCLGL